jgi:hypothetical protein
MVIVILKVLALVKSEMGWDCVICGYIIVDLQEYILLNVSCHGCPTFLWQRATPIILGWF